MTETDSTVWRRERRNSRTDLAHNNLAHHHHDKDHSERGFARKLSHMHTRFGFNWALLARSLARPLLKFHILCHSSTSTQEAAAERYLNGFYGMIGHHTDVRLRRG